ncbi:restriction endonuclease [Flavobacterium alvei]|uniref:Restriction endonuclease n=1 Tax=Flavobacterium alvei TaxID=2080416 RepID=A0A2S5A8D2_9FLAO|nr:HNH endonuclease [Flavobacterium alvei]POY38815.1 restriction endonuclease [Flavobacterium alvei]
MARDNWNKEQLIVALNLYWKIPYNKISGSSNSLIKQTAPIIDRTPAALAYKLMNFTSLDSEKQKIGNKGKSAASSSDKEIWNEYFGQWEKLALDSSAILATIQNKSIEDILELEPELKFTEGREKERIVKTRVNQNDFRQRILASYNGKCSITGISITSLLVASHIIPWSKNIQERLNPKNGICLNNIHDKAFDKGLITITSDFKVKLSDSILEKRKEKNIQKYFIEYENQPIVLPDRFSPSIEFLEYHHQNIFNK